jgi:hypothetical protein
LHHLLTPDVNNFQFIDFHFDMSAKPGSYANCQAKKVFSPPHIIIQVLVTFICILYLTPFYKAVPRYLTKSRFKLGLECPTKLYYTKKEEYFDQKLEDDFLQSLAEGGFQVGELAKLYYPGGINIDELDYEIALTKTNELLERSQVIIYEAAFLYQNFFIRTDLFIKNENEIQLIEVKAKSFDPENDTFLNSKNYITPEWAPYLYDAAFQKFVVKSSYPSFNISTYLLLADKTKTATVDGLNQKFVISKIDGRKQVKVKGPIDEKSLGERILTLQNIDPIIDKIYEGSALKEKDEMPFTERVHYLAEKYSADFKIAPTLSSACGSCEFRLANEDVGKGLKSGFHECWKEKGAFTDSDFLKPSVLNIWNFKKKNECIQSGIYFQDKKVIEEFAPAKQSKQKAMGLSQWERQVLQIEKSIKDDQSHYIDIPGLIETASEWQYPYHFIDFETTMVAIPFTSGRRPYEAIAFQFSHHVMYEDGKIEHKGQWLCNEPGAFPNFEFIRTLNKELSNDNGTIFCYASHENNILNAIYQQLLRSQENDKTSLCEWIKQISHSGNSSSEEWIGPRNMVDLKGVIQKFYYNPLTNGSISIKHVMPAILSSCDYLRTKYAQPIYGREIKSLNFVDQRWVQFTDKHALINPYQLLLPLNEDAENNSPMFFIEEGSGIYDGTAAMSAYAKMQFTDMVAAERERISKALLKYCELDTFAMVLIWEGLVHWMHENKLP